MARPPPSLQAQALRLLARREYSRDELENKLRDKASSAQALCAVLNHLEHQGLISAKRVAQSVLNRRGMQWGNARLRQEMLSKGLDKATITHHLQTLQTSEWERARALWSRKYGVLPTNTKEYARQMRFLHARGFSSDVIAKVLRSTMCDQ